MQSLLYVKSSDGTANASLMTVQTIRTALATTIVVNTVTGAPAGGFYASMGTPHTFTDPITSEVITVISDATAVDFAGHINAGQVIIDAIAPGYTDAGSKVGDIVVIRPVTEWANNIFNVLNQSLNDNGTIKNTAITYQPTVFDHVASGAVLTGLGYGSTLTASLSAGVCYINGIQQTIAAVATRTYTASKDTYVDALYSATGTVTIVYTEVANNAASPALAANSIRLGIVVSGANIAAATSVNQGQETMVLPIASGVAYSVTDSIGNLICPRDPARKILSIRRATAGFTTSSATDVQVTPLSCPIIIPFGRKIKATLTPRTFENNTANGFCAPTFWEGVVGSGTLKKRAYAGIPTVANATNIGGFTSSWTPATTNPVINAGLSAINTGIATISGTATEPTELIIELV